MMKIPFLATVLLSLAAVCQAGNREAPIETDVTSPEYCVTNKEGFAGVPITSTDPNTGDVNYIYAVTYNDAFTADIAISEVEVRIANYLLKESNHFSVCRRRRARVEKTGLRRLEGAKAIAITVNPSDEPTEVPCAGTAEIGTSCVVVEGKFMVYFEDGAAETFLTLNAMESDVETAMDNGSLVSEPIVSVEWMDSLAPQSPGDQANEAETGATVRSVSDGNDTSTATIVGASVGGILALALVAFYRRRSMKDQDDQTLSTGPPGGSAALG